MTKRIYNQVQPKREEDPNKGQYLGSLQIDVYEKSCNVINKDGIDPAIISKALVHSANIWTRTFSKINKVLN